MDAMKEGEQPDLIAAGTPLGDALKSLRDWRDKFPESSEQNDDCKIEIRNQEGLNPEIYISGTIGYNTTTQKVSDWLADQNGDVTVGINSRGGDAWEGIAINSILRYYNRGNVTTRIDGRAASAAGVIFLAGDDRQIMDTARLMLHEASIFGYVEGTKDRVKQQLENILQAMEQVNNSIVETIVKATGLSSEKAAKLVTANDQYFDAKTSVENKLATAVIKPAPKKSGGSKAEGLTNTEANREFATSILGTLFKG